MMHLTKEMGRVFEALALAESGDFKTARLLLNEGNRDGDKKDVQNVEEPRINKSVKESELWKEAKYTDFALKG